MRCLGGGADVAGDVRGGDELMKGKGVSTSVSVKMF